MYLKELKNTNCAKAQALEILYTEATAIPVLEQECHFNIDRDMQDDDHIAVCCSHQPYITKLLKSEYFNLQSVLISNNPKVPESVLEIKGNLNPKGLTIRKKIPQFTEEETKIRSERAKRVFSKTPDSI